MLLFECMKSCDQLKTEQSDWILQDSGNKCHCARNVAQTVIHHGVCHYGDKSSQLSEVILYSLVPIRSRSWQKTV